jgi:hypothetical protein
VQATQFADIFDIPQRYQGTAPVSGEMTAIQIVSILIAIPLYFLGRSLRAFTSSYGPTKLHVSHHSGLSNEIHKDHIQLHSRSKVKVHSTVIPQQIQINLKLNERGVIQPHQDRLGSNQADVPHNE